MSLIEKSDVKNHLSPHSEQKYIWANPKAGPIQPGFSVALNRTQSPKSGPIFSGFRRGTFVVWPICPANRSCYRLHSSGARGIKMRAAVKPHSVFLRSGCILPDRLDPCRQPIGEEWSVVDEIPALVFDTVIRQAGMAFHVAA